MSPSTKVTCRSLTTAGDYADAIRLYREGFDQPAGDTGIAPTLFNALQHHGGSVVGAFDADTDAMVGFSYGFVGLDHGLPYHHSQAAVVDPQRQGQGIGRLLKHAQRKVVAATGVTSMRWVYNPLLTRNAHFNFDVLGAVGRWFHRDYYGRVGQQHPDRVMVDWPVDRNPEPSTAVNPVGEVPEWGELAHEPARVWLALPRDWPGLARTDPAAAAAVYKQVTHHLEDMLAEDYVLVSCRAVDADTALYRAERSTR
jgi:predicted GNAT superfamily acetyltransferase